MNDSMPAQDTGTPGAANPPAAVEASRVSKVFGHGKDRVLALDDVSVQIRENEFFTLLGPSGCGKTTLLRLIAGFEHQTDGRILLYGEDISQLPPFKRPVNTVFQSYALFPHMTVAENIGFGLEMLDKPKADVEATVNEMLRLVKMDQLKHRRTDQISGGQQQRVALARALAPQPKVLLLDEPLSALDYKLRKEMQIELKRLQNETGITFVFVTHDQEEALTMSDRVAVMKDGRVLQVGAPHEIYDRPSERFVADFIGDTNFITADLVSSSNGEMSVRLSSGLEMSLRSDPPPGQATRVTLAVRPEQVTLSSDAAAAPLKGVLENVVYFGTDTLYHLRLPDGGAFTARVQNTRGHHELFESGHEIGIVFDPETVQVLRD